MLTPPPPAQIKKTHQISLRDIIIVGQYIPIFNKFKKFCVDIYVKLIGYISRTFVTAR